MTQGEAEMGGTLTLSSHFANKSWFSFASHLFSSYPSLSFFLFYFTLRKGRDAIYLQAAMMEIFSSVIRKAGFWTSLPHRAVWGANKIIWRRKFFEACIDPLCSKSMPHFHCEPQSRQIYCLLAEAFGKFHRRGGHLPSGNVGVWAGWGQGPWGDVLLHSFPLCLILLGKEVLPGLSIMAWEENSGVFVHYYLCSIQRRSLLNPSLLAAWLIVHFCYHIPNVGCSDLTPSVASKTWVVTRKNNEGWIVGTQAKWNF